MRLNQLELEQIYRVSRIDRHPIRIEIRVLLNLGQKWGFFEAAGGS